MSSLKQANLCWYFSNAGHGFLKSSNWTTILDFVSFFKRQPRGHFLTQATSCSKLPSTHP
jgi:hypothetical protein